MHASLGHYLARWRRGLFGAVLAAATAGSAQASEGGFVAGPVGGADVRAALLPPPGTYGIGMAAYERAPDLRSPNGSRSPAGLKGRVGGLAAGIGHVFDAEIAGGRLAAAAMTLASYTCVRLTAVNQRQCQVGQGDSYAELFWSRQLGELGLPGPAADDPRRQAIPYGLSVGLGFGVLIPTGAYRVRDIAPLGFNTWVAVPSLALTWISPPWLGDGTEVSARLFYDIHGRNPATGYQAGDMAVVDWAVTERLGLYQFGVTGSWARQVETDRLNGVRVASTSVSGYGAVAAMDIPAWGAFAALKYVQDAEARQRVRLNRVWLRLVMRL